MTKKDNSTSSVVTFKNTDGEDALMVLYNAAIEEATPVVRSINTNIYQNSYPPNISIRDGFDRWDYEKYRLDERIPIDERGMIAAAMAAYKKSGNGIIKNIVDLMTDFAVQGVDVIHSKKKIEKVFKFWFHKIVHGKERSERFVNMACRASNIIIKRDTAKVPIKVIRKMHRSTSAADVDYIEDVVNTEKRELPVRYTILHPLSVEIMSPQLSLFTGNTKKFFAIIVPPELVTNINYPSTRDQQELVNLIPPDIVAAVRAGTKQIPIDPDKVEAYYYKKDDWEVWAQPMIYCVLADVKHLEKMKLADLSALDGIMSQIRIWKIGDVANGIKPNANAMAKLASVLMNSVAGGIVDLVWTEDLKFQEVTTTVHKFLGEEKYVPILNSIYTGLGIPPLFTGSTNQGSFTNNFLAIKTLVERLESLRNLLREFWTKEFDIVCKALGIEEPPTLIFDRTTLNDESSILKILLDMVDRNMLSIETVQEMVGANPDVEEFRIKRNWKAQTDGKIPPKASPYHRAEKDFEYNDSFITKGELAPSQVGLDLEPLAKGETVPNDRPPINNGVGSTKKIPSGNKGGRPNGAKDAIKRKDKEVKPRRSVNNLIMLTSWASDTQVKISDIVTPIYLEINNKKNLRQLTNEEFNTLEDFKFAALCNLKPYENITEGSIQNLVSSKNSLMVPESVNEFLVEMCNQYIIENPNRELTIDKKREFQAIVYGAYNFEDSDA